MELDQLRYFLRVAEFGGFTKASQELGISQPALSRSIAKLEQELGQPMFERQTRHVVLTDAGRILQTRAEQILGMVDDAVSELSNDGDAGRIRIGAIPTIAPYFLPGILREFRDQCPRSKVVVYEETTGKLLHRCKQGEIDVAVLAAPIEVQYLEIEPLFDEELLLVLPEDHSLIDKRRLSLADLSAEPFILLDETHCLSGNIVAICQQRSFQPLSVEHTSQLTTVTELVALGHGVSLIPQMARDHDHSDRRAYRSLANPTPRRSILMAWNPYRFQSRLTERFKNCLRQAASKAV